MKRHEFVQEHSAASPYCGALVPDEDGCGKSCGAYRDDPIHAETRYDEFTQFWLRERPLTGEEESGIPMVASLCTDCGTVVVDIAAHERHHDELDNHYHRLGGSA